MMFLQVSDYEKEAEIMKTISKEEYLASLRRYIANPQCFLQTFLIVLKI